MSDDDKTSTETAPRKKRPAPKSAITWPTNGATLDRARRLIVAPKLFAAYDAALQAELDRAAVQVPLYMTPEQVEAFQAQSAEARRALIEAARAQPDTAQQIPALRNKVRAAIAGNPNWPPQKAIDRQFWKRLTSGRP